MHDRRLKLRPVAKFTCVVSLDEERKTETRAQISTGLQMSTQPRPELAKLMLKSNDLSFARTVLRLKIPHSIGLSYLAGKLERNVHKKQIDSHAEMRKAYHGGGTVRSML
jgi:hypothetical protein